MTTYTPEPTDCAPPASPLAAHQAFINDQLPVWLSQAPAPLRADFRSSLISSNQSRHDLKALLDELQSPETFARPLLRATLKAWFFGFIEDENAILSREWKNSHLLGLIKSHAKTTRQTLLEAALQNFEASEAELDGMETGTAIINVTTAGEVPCTILATSFARTCRALDLGSHYLKHIGNVLEPAKANANGRTAAHVLGMFRAQAQHAFGVALHSACMRQQLTPRQHLQLHSLQRSGAHLEITCSHLTLNNVVLPNVLVINAASIGIPLMLYTPEDPSSPFRQHASMDELQQKLAERLLTADYQAFFKHLVPLQHQGNLLSATPAVVGAPELITNRKTYPARLDAEVSLTAIKTDLFQAIARQRITQIKNDARSVAVPTAEADLMSRQKRLQAYLDLGKSALFFAASFIPIVGEVLLVVTAAQVLNTVYEGLAAWSRGDSDEALNDLLDVLDTAAQAVATAGAIRTVGFGARLVKVRVRGKGWRLWNPDLAPYRHPAPLPSHWVADSQGLYKQGQQHYLKLDDHPHAVQRAPDGTQWELSHPSVQDAYCPPLLSNGVGSWRQTHEAPGDWDALKLIKRLGPDAATVTQTKVEPILLLGGVDRAGLREVHQHRLRPPPLLRDTLKHFNLEQEINDFNLERAEGTSVTAHSPLIQFHLLTSLPEWPANHVLKIIGEQRNVVMSYGTGTVEIRISEARFRKGELLHALEERIPQTEFNKLLLDWYPDYFTKVENVAMRLENQAQQQKQRLLSLLTAPGEKAITPTEIRIRALMPQLSKSHLEEMEACLSPAEQQSLQLDNRLAPLPRWEAEQYAAAARESRAWSGVFLDSMSDRESVPLALHTIERLPGWPSSHKIDVYDGSREGELLGSIGPADARVHHTLLRQGELYTCLDAEGQPSDSLDDLPGTLEQTLSDPERAALLEQSGADSLKHAIQQTSLSHTASPPAVRAKVLTSTHSTAAGQPLDPLLAQASTPTGLTRLEDAIYQAPALPDGSSRHYVKDNGKYYQIKLGALGWQLIDARSPFRPYRPYLRRTAAGRWEIDPTKGALPGGMQSSQVPLLVQMESSDVFESAQSSSDYDSADEGTVAAMFTAQELRHMRAQRSYQFSQNYRRIFDRANNGRYPLRDQQGRPMRIKSLQTRSKSLTTNETFSSDLVKPYIQWEGYEHVARLYEDKLEVTPFSPAHQKFPEESALIGQATVITRKPIKKGEALGVYGGELIPNSVAGFRKDPYLLDIQRMPPRPGHYPPSLSGDNVLSRINTIFEYEDGQPVRQASTGYNVEAARFEVETQVGEESRMPLALSAFFASEDIAAGTELRWNYQYNEATISALFGPLH
ncbi:hypothetical protein F0169_22740 [Pseudomonas sp. MAFF 212408]|uniref:SET domain-containing protein n=1 Tax=Pseudomonas kitaguniensis TaxID=2607908 RepID=A0A5N7KR47_9PSED|nr:SET domain-containing protein [Pseudomonas kitaguniensis]MPR04639.1 hypothetical protein [Pseudomonas kitaguniensis]